MNVWTLVGVGLNASVIGMTIAWYVGRRLKNAGYIEALWPVVFGLVVSIYALAGGGAPMRRAIIGGAVALWALRLGSYLVVRVARQHTVEDLRYRELRKQFPKRPWHMFFGFAQLQAILIGLLSIPLAIICSNPSPTLAPLEFVALALWAIGWFGEFVADMQLDRFRRQPGNETKVYSSGMWYFSRHPNYFCEWLIWVAYFLFAVAAGSWVSIYLPLLMLLLLTKITGLPAVEARALQSRGAEYEKYQRRTSPFIPWFPHRKSL